MKRAQRLPKRRRAYAASWPPLLHIDKRLPAAQSSAEIPEFSLGLLRRCPLALAMLIEEERCAGCEREDRERSANPNRE